MLFQAASIALPLEITAFSAMIQFWDEDVSLFVHKSTFQLKPHG